MYVREYTGKLGLIISPKMNEIKNLGILSLNIISEYKKMILMTIAFEIILHV